MERGIGLRLSGGLAHRILHPILTLRMLAKTINAYLDSRRLGGRFFKLIDRTKETDLLHNERDILFRRLQEKIVAAGGTVVSENACGEQIVVEAENFTVIPTEPDDAWHEECHTKVYIVFRERKTSEHSISWSTVSSPVLFPERLFDDAVRAIAATLPDHQLCVG